MIRTSVRCLTELAYGLDEQLVTGLAGPNPVAPSPIKPRSRRPADNPGMPRSFSDRRSGLSHRRHLAGTHVARIATSLASSSRSMAIGTVRVTGPDTAVQDNVTPPTMLVVSSRS